MESWMGTILPVAYGYAPQYWLMAHGQALTIQQYSALYSLFGASYGGNPPVDFKLPDLRARVPVGFDPRNVAYALAKSGGSETTVLAQKHLPAHTHAARFEPRKGEVTAQIPAQAGTLADGETEGLQNGRLTPGAGGVGLSGREFQPDCQELYVHLHGHR